MNRPNLMIVFTACLAATALTSPAHAQAPSELRGFDAADADGDGLVTPDELRALRAERAAALDANGDGLLSAEELTTFFQGQSEERIARRVARMLDRLDTDGDGNLSAAEFAAGRTQEIGQRAFQNADVNGDGAISREEFENARSERAERREERRNERRENRGGRNGG